MQGMQDLKYAMDAIHRITQESIDAIVKLYVASGSAGNQGSPNHSPKVNFGESAISPSVNFGESANFGDLPVPANIANSQGPKQFELREDPRYNILQCSAPSQNSPNSPSANIPKRAEYVDPNLHNFTL